MYYFKIKAACVGQLSFSSIFQICSGFDSVKAVSTDRERERKTEEEKERLTDGSITEL